MGSGNDRLEQFWTVHLEADGKSTRTIDLYRSVLAMFRRYSDDMDLEDVTHDDLEGWFAEQHRSGLSQSTRRSRWIALRNFYGWLVDVDRVAENPMAKLKVAKAEPPPVEVIDDATLKRFLGTCDPKTLKGARDIAIIRLMAGSGLRLGEVARLRVDDISIADRVLRILGKGGRERVVRFDKVTASALTRYLLKRDDHRDADKSDALWLGHLGPLTGAGIQHIFDQKSEQIGTNVYPHMLRHRFAHTFLANGGNEGDLQALGGWQSREVMGRYGASLRTERALDAYDNVDPLGGV